MAERIWWSRYYHCSPTAHKIEAMAASSPTSRPLQQWRPSVRTLLLVAAMLAAVGPWHRLHAGRLADPDYLGLYRQGVNFATFLERARTRPDEWKQRYNDAAVTPDMLTRMRALPDRRLVLGVAEDWCTDSMNSIPYVARLADGAPERIALRIIDSTLGRPIMDAHLTPDARAATPTIVVLREDGAPVGSWVERPSTAQAWFLEQRKIVTRGTLRTQLRQWYADDGGRTTVAEIAALLER